MTRFLEVVLPVAAVLSAAALLLVCLWILSCRLLHHFRRQKAPATQDSSSPTIVVVAFFHPHCSAGGGGERVLWKAVQVLGEMHEGGECALEVVIYTIDKEQKRYKQDVLRHVQSRFSIALSEKLPLSFVHLDRYAHFLEPCRRFSLLGESWGTMKLVYKALERTTPHVFFDTTGCAFTYFVARVLAGCRVAAYVHYPTISTDMLSLVWERRPSYNHDPDIARSLPTTVIKLVYYSVFAIAYGCVGSLANLVLVNSSWTYEHISFLWRGASRRIKIVFPPCDVAGLVDIPVSANRQRIVLSIGQFRPEKDHELQIRAFARLLENHVEMRDARLVLVGSCRGEEDGNRVETYRLLVERLGIAKNVSFVLNEPSSVVKEWLGRASVGLHTMWNEHFGIGVVEMMAAGMLVVAHDSGGPKMDILLPMGGHRTGFLASSIDGYGDAMYKALCMNYSETIGLREKARASALRFSDEVFSSSFRKAVLESGLLTM